MKITIVVFALCVRSIYTDKSPEAENAKDKRQALGYQSSGHSTQTFHIQPAVSQDGGNAISIGAGYSIGGAKPRYPFESHSESPSYQQTHGLSNVEGQTIRLPPITLSPHNGHLLAGGDLTQLMNQLQHSLNTGALALNTPSQYQAGTRKIPLKQLSFGAPKKQQYNIENHSNAEPSYASGSKGLGAYGSTGPVLFNPNDNHQQQTSQLSANSGHSAAAVDLANLNSLTFDQGALQSGFVINGSPYGQAQNSHSLGKNANGPIHPGPTYNFGGYYRPSSSDTLFKTSSLLGLSAADSSHGSSGIEPTYHNTLPNAHSVSLGNSHLTLGVSPHGGYSFDQNNRGSSLPGLNLGASKFISSSYVPSQPGYGLDSKKTFVNSGRVPGSSISIGAHSISPGYNPSSAGLYYRTLIKQSPQAPATSHGSFSSLNFSKYAPKLQSVPNIRDFPQKDSNGAFSQPAYNTIQYSEELKPSNY